MGQHILIVEDDLDTLELLASYFIRYDYQVETAAFGEDAVSKATATPPDLVVLDIRLPDIDGYEVCRRLSTQQRTAQVPVIFLTEKRERDSRIAGLQLGAVDYISKPFDIHELRLRVENALRRAEFRPLNHPVTGLPGEQLLFEHLDSLREESGWAVIHIELEGLDAFDAMYGFVTRDDLLRAVGMSIQALANESAKPAGFAAHLDEGIFCLVAGAGQAAALMDSLGKRLQRIATRFYPVRDVEAGSVHGQPLPMIQIYAGVADEASMPANRWYDLVRVAREKRQLLSNAPAK